MLDDRVARRVLQIEHVEDTGERIAALEAVEPERAKSRETSLDENRGSGREHDISAPRGRDKALDRGAEKTMEPRWIERDFEL